jgi:gluconolactonase
MPIPSGMSRRTVLTGTGAIAAAIVADGPPPPMAQAMSRIERFDPALDSLIDTSQAIQLLARGFGGPLGAAEGPVWWHERGYLTFNDIHASKRMRYTPAKGVTLDFEPTNRANGSTRDLQGRLLSCEHDTRRVTRRELDGSLTVIANSFQGKRFNRPNDVVVKSDGSIYFTDPGAMIVPEQWDVQFSGVYRVTPDLDTLTLLTDSFVNPNGLAFSPDEKTLYINDSSRRHIRAFEVLPNGMLAKHTGDVFAELGGKEPGNPDGIKIDTAGNIYSTGTGGIWILDPKGRRLGRIVHGDAYTLNLAFGGKDWTTIYFLARPAARDVGSSSLRAVSVKIPGLPVPTPAPRP